MHELITTGPALLGTPLAHWQALPGAVRESAESLGGNSLNTVAVVGPGYVGLPLAVEFGERLRTIGYDKAERKLATPRAGSDLCGEVPSAERREASGLRGCFIHVKSQFNRAAVEAAAHKVSRL